MLTTEAGVTVPVLDRPRLKQLIKVSGARADEAVIAYEKVVQTAYAESENALTELEAIGMVLCNMRVHVLAWPLALISCT